ncbi:unnamed protein product [Lathyrus oleraceus]|uniref:uncharacterized protein LOC127073872 isoform X3 n=1 Tax=Pisum sativum TaxID=3888 RepID=UPI001FC3F6E7|nr:uncharacterized protein LOC127073872 isoform X3 [Pisum sativum]
MDDSEKLTALKKAYADIILNTAKEAAARIMVSERKSTRFQQELAYTKDEALRMVLRLKQMLDSKVKEAELTSLSQQKKIEELEAQLQEAEEIVRDLRAELRETQAELENVTKKHEAHPPVEQNMKDEIAANGSFLQENRLEPSDATVHSEPDLQFESVSVSDTVCPTVNGIENGSTFCVSRDHANSFYIHNPDFASIVIRRKEPELYRNGCTQRIRALERSIFDGNVSVAGDLDNARDETLAGAHEEDKEATVAANGKANIICENEKPDELEVVKEGADLVKCLPLIKNRRFRKRKTHLSRLHSDQLKETTKESYLSAAKDSPHVLDDNDTSKVNSSIAHENEARKNLMSHVAEAPTDATATVEQPDKLQVVKAGGDLIKDLVHRKRKRFRIRRTRRSRLHSDLVKEANKESNLTRAKDSDHVLGNNNNDSSTVNSSVAHENEAQKDLMSPFAKAPKDATTAVERLGSHTNTEKGEIFLKGCSSKNKIEDDKESLDKSDLTRQESLSTESIKVPSCTDVVEVAGDGSPDKMDSKVSNKDEKVSSRFENDKLLKYTFQRKRKKGSVSSGDVGCSPDNSSSKKICGEKQNGHAEPQKSCTMTESSRESRRLAQVARQLISLSEKKWWQ